MEALSTAAPWGRDELLISCFCMGTSASDPKQLFPNARQDSWAEEGLPRIHTLQGPVCEHHGTLENGLGSHQLLFGGLALSSSFSPSYGGNTGSSGHRASTLRSWSLLSPRGSEWPSFAAPCRPLLCLRQPQGQCLTSG